MKLWILYRVSYETNSTFSPELMMAAAKNNGIDAELFYFNYFVFKVENGRTNLYYKDKKVLSENLPDVVFCRGYYIDLLQHFEKNGVKVINGSEGMQLMRNKFETYTATCGLLGANISQPKTLKGAHLKYDTVVENFGIPFIMKDNFGAMGKSVYLVNSREQFEEIMKNDSKIEFIFQEYIDTSKGKDVRVYVVGKEAIGGVRRVSTTDDFRSNIHQSGEAFLEELTPELKETALKIANKIGLEIGSVDFLFGKNGFVFNEANGNATFFSFYKFGFDMQNLFMKYIKETYDNLVNIIAQKARLTHRENSFEILEGRLPILVSAPHNVKQIREGKTKPIDLGSGHLMLDVVNKTNCFGIIKTNCVGMEGEKDDDANYEKQHPYKDAVLNETNKHNLKALLDLHTMAEDRKELVNIGIYGGKNIHDNYEVLQKVVHTFEDFGYPVSLDEPFNAPPHTVAGFLATETNAFCLQIELNSKLIYKKDKRNEFSNVSDCLVKIVNQLNESL